MKLYLAPMEGITGTIVRNAFVRHFKGIDKCFSPFIPVGNSWNFKIKRDLDPDNNIDVNLIPQAISTDCEDLLALEKKLMDLGYDEYNLNMGCPSGTVVSKGRGAGALLDTARLDTLLYNLFSRTNMKISIKTRIGLTHTEEWDGILDIFFKYPLEELIVHPRLKSELYKGLPHVECYEMAYLRAKKYSNSIPLCYNGDINDLTDYKKIKAEFPDTAAIMIGRGALRRPWIFEELQTNSTPANLKERLRAFHDSIYEGYSDIFSGPRDTLMHMKEIWTYLGDSFPGCERHLKKLKKTRDSQEYTDIVNELFEMTSWDKAPETAS